MANYHFNISVKDLEEDQASASGYLVTSSNASASTMVGGLCSVMDEHIDGTINSIYLERSILVDLPTGLKENAVEGSRIEEKIKIVFDVDSDNPDKNKSLSLPGRLVTSLEAGTKNATAAFITATTTRFVKSSTPYHLDSSFNRITSLESAKEDYTHKATQKSRWG
jgi:hypothetical protein